MCGTCLPRYQLSSPNCSKLISSQTDFKSAMKQQLAATSPMSTNQTSVLDVSKWFSVATGTFHPPVFVTPYPTSSLSFGSSSWTVQFYFGYNSFDRSPHTYFEGMFDFIGPSGTVNLLYRSQYTQSPTNVNKLELYFRVVTTSSFTSSRLEVPYGEWLFVTF